MIFLRKVSADEPIDVKVKNLLTQPEKKQHLKFLLDAAIREAAQISPDEKIPHNSFKVILKTISENGSKIFGNFKYQHNRRFLVRIMAVIFALQTSAIGYLLVTRQKNVQTVESNTGKTDPLADAKAKQKEQELAKKKAEAQKLADQKAEENEKEEKKKAVRKPKPKLKDEDVEVRAKPEKEISASKYEFKIKGRTAEDRPAIEGQR